MIRRRSVTASIGYSSRKALEVVDMRAVQDEGAIPWLTVDMTVTRPSDAATRSLLDPTRPANVLEFGSDAGTGDVDPVNMREQVLLDTVEDVDDDTTRITGYSHDRRLLDYYPTTEDRSAWARQANIYNAVAAVLQRVYGSWRRITPPGGADIVSTPFVTYLPLTNLVANGGFEGGVTGWDESPHGVDVKLSTSWKASGVNSMALVPTPGSTSVANYAEVDVSLEPGKTYTMGGTAAILSYLSGNAGLYGRRITIAARVAGAYKVIAQTNAAANSGGATTVLRSTFTTPINATEFTMRVYHGSLPTSTGNALYVDNIFCYEGNGLESNGTTQVGYFDGATASGTGGFNYSWSGDVNNSPSVRVGVIDRPPEVLTWSPDQSAYDFLEPIFQAIGWRIIPAGIDRSAATPVYQFYIVTSKWIGRTGAALQVSTGDNLYAAGQVRSLSQTFSDGTPMYADAVILTYQWVDPQGTEQTRVDAYAPAGYTLPYVLQINQPWPGPGRAQALYRRFQARARRATATVRLGSDVQAGASITLTSSQSGTVLATIDQAIIDYVEGTVDVTTKAAVDLPANAWITATTTWQTVTGTWNTYNS